MALKRPPTHRIDAPIQFVHPSDTAWDEPRVLAEQQRMREAELDPTRHPVARYRGGWTRYDLGAEATLFGDVVSIRDYLDDSKQPTIWTLRRLTVSEWYEVHPIWQRETRAGMPPYAAYLRCATIGIRKVENGPTLELTGGRLSASDLDKLHRLGQGGEFDLIFDLGEAVYQASMPLREEEKTPFA